jgi:predicted ferric reductase
VSFFGSLFSFGELAFFSLFLLLISLWLYYWIGSHNFHGKDATVTEKEILFRSLGQLAVLVMALLMVPAARSSLVASFFRVSWEAAIQYHRWLGILWVGCVLAHIIAYWV